MIADQTGGCVSDSLEMARFGNDHAATTLVVAGVRFMGETAKILSPDKRVLMPTLEATCSLDLGCPMKSCSANLLILKSTFTFSPCIDSFNSLF